MAMRAPAAHILIVDDDPAIREGLTLAFKGTYVVHAAATGDEACAVVRRYRVAAIVLDAILGAEHGLDLIEKFRALSQAPILILTGYGTEELAIRALRAKADEYLKKPVNLRELYTALARLVSRVEIPLDPTTQARLYLSEHLDRSSTTVSVATQVGLSERQLRRRFQEAYGKTPRRYLTDLRMERAATLLRTTDVPIVRVARTVGYPSVATFVRIFKRAYRLTPSEFRHGKAGGCGATEADS